MRLLLPIAAAVTLAGCSFGDDIPAANKAIDGFHAALNNAQFAEIYDGSAPQMKSTTTKDRLTQLLSAVHRKLGAFRSGKAVGWNDNVTPAGHFVTLNYAATYDHGAAQENFVYSIAGAKAVLAGYHVNSDALILN